MNARCPTDRESAQYDEMSATDKYPLVVWPPPLLLLVPLME